MRARRAPNPSGPRTRRAIQQACAKPRRRTIRCARRVHTPWFVNHHHDNPSRDDGFALVGSERHPALLVLPLMGVGYAVAEMIESGGVIIGGSAGIANDLAKAGSRPGSMTAIESRRRMNTGSLNTGSYGRGRPPTRRRSGRRSIRISRSANRRRSSNADPATGRARQSFRQAGTSARARRAILRHPDQLVVRGIGVDVAFALDDERRRRDAAAHECCEIETKGSDARWLSRTVAMT